MEYCPSCGEKLPQDANTCPHCGYRLTQEDKMRSAQITKSTGRTPPAKKKNKGKKVIVMILISVLLLGCIGKVLTSLQDNDENGTLNSTTDGKGEENTRNPAEKCEHETATGGGCIDPLVCADCGTQLLAAQGHSWKEPEPNKFKLVTFRHILIKFKGGETDPHTGETVYSEEEKHLAKTNAVQLLETFIAGERTEEAFAELANQHSDDKAKNGGLYEYVYNGQMVEPINAWIFDESQTAGNCAIIESAYGYHVVYFVNSQMYCIDNDTPQYCERCHETNGEIVVCPKTIAVIGESDTHPFWKAVKQGAIDAGDAAGYTVTFCGPQKNSPNRFAEQREMMWTALSNSSTDAIVIAPMSGGIAEQLRTAYKKKIPVVTVVHRIWTSDKQDLETTNPVVANVTTDDWINGAYAAEKFYDCLKSKGVLHNGYRVGIIDSGVYRAEGFSRKLHELAFTDGITLDINLQIDFVNNLEHRQALVEMKTWGAQAIFLAEEDVVNEVYEEVINDVVAYKHILFCGVNVGTNQYNWIKDAGENYALLVGVVTEDPYTMGYKAVEAAIAKLEGKMVTDIGISGVWYNKDNIDELFLP